MADKFISKIKVGTESYKMKDPVLHDVGIAVKGITDVSEDASIEDLAKKMNEILSKFRTLTCLAVICGMSVFSSFLAHAAGAVEPLTCLHKKIPGNVPVVTNQVEWVSSVTNSLATTNFVIEKVGVVASNYIKSVSISDDRMTLYLTNVVDGVTYGTRFDGLINAMESTNIAKYVVNQNINRNPCWTKQGGWALDYKLDASSETTVYTDYVTNAYYQIFKTTGLLVTYSLSADLFLKMLDEYATETPVITNYVCQTGGGTITSDGHLTAISNGIYACWAQATDGQSGKVNVPINTTVQGTAEVTTYDADVVGTTRKAVNDAELALINAATSAGTGTYSGKTYYKWNYFTQPAWAATSAGQFGRWAPFAIGTKMMIGAHHYGYLDTGDQVVGGQTVTKGPWVHLETWALANGWTAEELKKMYRISDISVSVLTAGTIPLTDLPYLMSEEQFNSTFPSAENVDGNGIQGVQGWCAVQAYAQPTPLVFSGTYGASFWVSQDDEPSYIANYRRSDIALAFDTKGAVYPVHVGDSGHPIYFRRNGKYVLTSHFWWAGTGPSYVQALPVLKAFAEAHGSQLRLWDEP